MTNIVVNPRTRSLGSCYAKDDTAWSARLRPDEGVGRDKSPPQPGIAFCFVVFGWGRAAREEDGRESMGRYRKRVSGCWPEFQLCAGELVPVACENGSRKKACL